MIRHIVLFRLAADDIAQRDRDAAELGARLEALVGVVPGVDDLQVRPDLGEVDGHWDVALVSHHQNRAALASYASDARHRAVIAWVDGVASARAVVDYEIG
ncbi:MAG: Dabb family protein [Nocardioides sp.]|uniref:Dabb family protein n=1 Tax=Nocardioides sp. TaxID=35761 RepID=UPI0039E335A7